MEPAGLRDARVAIIDETIRERHTAKILRDPLHCAELAADLATSLHQTLQELIEVAGWAPVHQAADAQAHRQGDLSSIVPWRFYVLEKPACCRLVRLLEEQAATHPDSQWATAWRSKIPRLLAGCGALVQVTWLPDLPSTSDTPELTVANMEHIAAAAAAVQNLLVAAQARGLHSYWSSGGILRDGAIFDVLGIPRNQILLGAIFLAHPDQPYDERQPGGLRQKRGEPADWATWIT